MRKSFLGYLLRKSDSILGTLPAVIMLQIPILSRLKLGDYFSLIAAIVVLSVEWSLRVCLFFFPFSIVDHLRYQIIGLLPRVFKGFQDEEIDELKQPMVRSKNAKDMVENAVDGAGRYCLEEHAVFTPDGYILILHRLCFKKKPAEIDNSETFGNGLYEKRSKCSKAPPVLLNHGSMMSSEVWLAAPSRSIAGEEKIPCTLAHALLHAGYDVWLTNRRGNKYSCKHTNLHTASNEFWSFSLDEPAIRDLPAVIDYICAETEFPSLSIIGFSQGSAEALGSLSMVKALNRKVNLAILLAPTTRPKVSGFKTKIIQSVVKMTPELVFLFFGRKIMLGFVPFWREVLSPRFYVHMMDLLMQWIFGWHSQNMELEDKIIFYQHLFSYTSVKQIVHWFQIMRAKRFQMYDEGPSMEIGCGHLPPAYPLGQITAPVVLFDGTADSLHDASLRQLPAVVAKYTVQGYEHLDFLWAESLSRKVWPVMVSLLNRLEADKAMLIESSSDVLISSETPLQLHFQKFGKRRSSKARVPSPPSSASEIEK